jgi:hypothetical protein
MGDFLSLVQLDLPVKVVVVGGVIDSPTSKEVTDFRPQDRAPFSSHSLPSGSRL